MSRSIFLPPPPTEAEIFRHLWETEQTLKSLAENTAQIRRRIEENYQRENPDKPSQLYIDAGLLKSKKYENPTGFSFHNDCIAINS